MLGLGFKAEGLRFALSIRIAQKPFYSMDVGPKSLNIYGSLEPLG